MRRTPALIAGGGPAGSVAALLLARGGATPLVLERSREPQDALCGGFLSWRTLESLAGAGIDPAILGGHTVRRVVLFAGRRRVESSLPAPATGLSRRRLDALLLGAAQRAGARVERGVTIRSAEGTTLHTGDGATLTGDTLFLATGKHDLRGAMRDADVGDDPAMGVRVRLAAHPALTRGRTLVRARGDKPGLFAVSRFDPVTGAEMLLAYNTSAKPLTSAIQVETRSTRFDTLAGACAARATAPGSVTLTIPAFGYAVCAAETR